MSKQKKVKGPLCVFYQDVPCPVRREIAKRTRSIFVKKHILPLAKDFDTLEFMKKYTEALKEILDQFIGEFSTIHYFCEICQTKRNKDMKA